MFPALKWYMYMCVCVYSRFSCILQFWLMLFYKALMLVQIERVLFNFLSSTRTWTFNISVTKVCLWSSFVHLISSQLFPQDPSSWSWKWPVSREESPLKFCTLISPCELHAQHVATLLILPDLTVLGELYDSQSSLLWKVHMSSVRQMSLVPLLFHDWWDDLDRPSRLLDQHFGLGLRHHELLHPRSLLRTGYIRPWRNITRQDSGSSNITADKEKFQVSIALVDYVSVNAMREWMNRWVYEEYLQWMDDPLFYQTASVPFVVIQMTRKFSQTKVSALLK